MFSERALLVLDDLMAEGGQDKALLDLFTKHSHHQNITIVKLYILALLTNKLSKRFSYRLILRFSNDFFVDVGIEQVILRVVRSIKEVLILLRVLVHIFRWI